MNANSIMDANSIMHANLLYIYSKNPDNQFHIKVMNNNISVSIPLTNIKFNYRTTLNSYFYASEYILARLEDFHHDKN